ncbi:short chain dehydrogenase [Popillia japonica]|uniref:Short chain dehydrogenase n=1 Tax=Popillia japonica TaxID=7064 RepID=A0AAW1MF15_POPJA
MHFNKLFTFLKCFKCGHSNSKRFNSNLTETTNVLMKRLDLTKDKSQKLVEKYKLQSTEIDTLKETLSALELLGYSKEDVLEYPLVLKKTKRKLQEEYLEAGFCNLTISAIANFRKLLKKKISTLKVMKFIPPHINVPENLIMHLQPKPVDFSAGDFTEEDVFGQIHALIVKRYLEWRLDVTSDEIETFFRIYSLQLKYKSLQRLCENIEIALDLGFTPKKLLSFGYLLSNDPNNPKEVLQKIPDLAGADMRVMFRRYPKLVTVPIGQFKKIYKILKEEDIPDSTIQKQMNVFTLSPHTIKARFAEIKEIPEMNVLRHSPRILRLIVHHNRAKSRLSFMHQLQLKCASMCLLEHDNEHYFNYHVRNTKDTNVLNDIITLLKHLLNSDAPDIEYNLKKHPYHLQVPLVNIEKTCKHIQRSFSNNAIIRVAPIVLYPSEKIEDALTQIKSMTDLPQTRLTEAKKLNLALYLIEKDHHFTGDGVWEKPQVPKSRMLSDTFLSYVCITIVLFQLSRFVLVGLYNHFFATRLGIKFVDFKYLGKWAVVTGCTDGIGKAFAEKLAEEGMSVYLISRSQDKLDDLAKSINSKYKVDTKTLAIDFTQGDEIYNLMEKNIAELEVGVLVNNVGLSYSHPEYFLNVEDKDVLFKDIIRINCCAVVNMCKIALPGMVERKRGAIINISSLAANIPQPLLTVYSASKAFVDKFSLDLALEYESRGITIQSLLPGYVATKMSKIRGESLMAPSPKTYVNNAIRSLGVQGRTTGYFPHTVMSYLMNAITPQIGNMIVMNTLLNIRKRALKQKNKAKAAY